MFLFSLKSSNQSCETGSDIIKKSRTPAVDYVLGCISTKT